MNVKAAAEMTMDLASKMKGQSREKAAFLHVMEMLESIAQGKITGYKANRWLGWAQCAIYCASDLPLEAFKDINHRA